MNSDPDPQHWLTGCCLPVVLAALLLLPDGDATPAGLEDPGARVGIHLGREAELGVVLHRMVGHLHSASHHHHHHKLII